MPDPTATRHQGSPTSTAAFADGEAGHEDIKGKILAVLEAQGDYGITADEFAKRLNVGVNTISGRFSQLAAESKIRRSGRTRPTRTGSQATVWVIETPQLMFPI